MSARKTPAGPDGLHAAAWIAGAVLFAVATVALAAWAGRPRPLDHPYAVGRRRTRSRHQSRPRPHDHPRLGPLATHRVGRLQPRVPVRPRRTGFGRDHGDRDRCLSRRRACRRQRAPRDTCRRSNRVDSSSSPLAQPGAHVPNTRRRDRRPSHRPGAGNRDGTRRQPDPRRHRRPRRRRGDRLAQRAGVRRQSRDLPRSARRKRRPREKAVPHRPRRRAAILRRTRPHRRPRPMAPIRQPGGNDQLPHGVAPRRGEQPARARRPGARFGCGRPGGSRTDRLPRLLRQHFGRADPGAGSGTGMRRGRSSRVGPFLPHASRGAAARGLRPVHRRPRSGDGGHHAVHPPAPRCRRSRQRERLDRPDGNAGALRRTRPLEPFRPDRHLLRRQLPGPVRTHPATSIQQTRPGNRQLHAPHRGGVGFRRARCLGPIRRLREHDPRTRLVDLLPVPRGVRERNPHVGRVPGRYPGNRQRRAPVRRHPGGYPRPCPVRSARRPGRTGRRPLSRTRQARARLRLLEGTLHRAPPGQRDVGAARSRGLARPETGLHPQPAHRLRRRRLEDRTRRQTPAGVCGASPSRSPTRTDASSSTVW